MLLFKSISGPAYRFAAAAQPVTLALWSIGSDQWAIAVQTNLDAVLWPVPHRYPVEFCSM